MKLHAPIKGIFFDIGWVLLQTISQNWLIPSKMKEYVDAKICDNIPQTAAFEQASKCLDDNHLLLSEDDELKQFEVFYQMLAEDLTELGLTKKNKYARLPMQRCMIIIICFSTIQQQLLKHYIADTN